MALVCLPTLHVPPASGKAACFLVVDNVGGEACVKNLLPFPYTAILEQLREARALAIGRE